MDKREEPASGQCLICGAPTKLKVKSKQFFAETCSVSCGAKLGQRRLLEKTGGVHPSQTAEAKKKRQQTNLKKYGAECVLHLGESKKKAAAAQAKKEVKLKIANTLKERYGVTSPLKHGEFKRRQEETVFERYGVKNAMQSPKIKEKNRKSNKETYLENEFPTKKRLLSSIGIIPLFSETEYDGTGKTYPWKHSCGLEFEQELKNNGQLVRCPQCHPEKFSLAQSLIQNFLIELGETVSVNNRSAIKPLEIDIFLPHRNLGIEINGVYWHQDDFGKTPILKKSELAREAGIDLLHFWDFEVLNKQEIVKNIVLSKLGRLPRKIFARKCEVKEISDREARSFFEKTHLAGAVKGAKVSVGLFHNGELVAVASVGKSRFSKNEIELFRFSSQLGVQVVGGLSRLIKAIKLLIKCDSIVTYADARISNGAAYSKLGTFLRKTTPNYWHVAGHGTGVQMISRYAAQKHKLHRLIENFDPALSEAENAKRAGWIKISDCGNLKYIL